MDDNAIRQVLTAELVAKSEPPYRSAEREEDVPEEYGDYAMP